MRAVDYALLCSESQGYLAYIARNLQPQTPNRTPHNGPAAFSPNALYMVFLNSSGVRGHTPKIHNWGLGLIPSAYEGIREWIVAAVQGHYAATAEEIHALIAYEAPGNKPGPRFRDRKR